MNNSTYNPRWFWNRVPNARETFTTITATSFFGACLGQVNALFGDNPVARVVLRDMTKVPGVLIAVFFNYEVGSTGYTYDNGHALSSITKPACKLILIGGFFYLYGGVGLSSAGKAANYPCDSLARFFIVVGKRQQDANALKQPYWKFIANNFEWAWVWESIASAVVKDVVMEGVGELIKKLHISTTLIEYGTQFSTEHQIAPEEYLMQKTFSFVCLWAANFVSELINTCMFAVPARIIQDGMSDIIAAQSSPEKGSYVDYVIAGGLGGALIAIASPLSGGSFYAEVFAGAVTGGVLAFISDTYTQSIVGETALAS